MGFIESSQGYRMRPYLEQSAALASKVTQHVKVFTSKPKFNLWDPLIPKSCPYMHAMGIPQLAAFTHKIRKWTLKSPLEKGAEKVVLFCPHITT